jgi:hypothetical protein
MTDVIIHFFQGTSTEPPEAFDEMKEQGIDGFKNYLLVVLGHVGISFPPDNTVYGFGPNITQEYLDKLKPYYSRKRKSDWSREKIKWNALNFLFDEMSPEFEGIISDDGQFFDEHKHIKIPLISEVNAKETLDRFKSMHGKPYGSPYMDAAKENCITAIFNHLPLMYSDGRNVAETLSELAMLTKTLQDLQKNLEPTEAGERKGGRKTKKRRKTKRKRRKRRKKKTRRNKRKKKKLKKKFF